MQQPGTQTLTAVLQQRHGGLTQSVVWIGAGGQQHPLPAAALSALVASAAKAIAAIASIERTRNMFFPSEDLVYFCIEQ